MAKSKSRLLEQISKITPYRKPCWVDSLPKNVRDDLLSLKAAFKAGELRDAAGCQPSLSSIRDLVVKEYGIVVARTTFVEWMRR